MEYWNKRRSALAVNGDFRAMDSIPEMFYPSCINEFARWGNKMTEKDKDEWAEMFNKQNEKFIKNVIRQCPRLSRFVVENKKTSSVEMTIRDNEHKEHVVKPKEPVMPKEMFEYSFSEDKDVMGPETFLSLDAKDRTLERLMETLNSSSLFPPDFIERLSLPNKNAYYYKQAGDKKMEEYWNAQKLPYLNKEICMKIAFEHAEGSIRTSPYITKEGVLKFWNRYKDTLSDSVMTTYFMSFPGELLDPLMAPKLKLSWQVLAHAPEALCNTEEADRYLKRYPWDVLKLPECYQSADRLIAAGVKLTKETLKYIKNADMREKIALALNIR